MNSQDPPSLTARRPAASSLPSFQLPPPPDLPVVQKFSPFATGSLSQPGLVSAGNLLTPPSTVPGDALGSVSAVAPSSSNASYPAITPYTPVGFMSQGVFGAPSYGLGPRQASSSNFGTAQSPGRSLRGAFSPSFPSSLRQSPHATPTTDGYSLPPPPYDFSAQQFTTAMSLAGVTTTAGTASLHAMLPQQPGLPNSLLNPPPPPPPLPSGTATLLSPLHHASPRLHSSRAADNQAYYPAPQPSSAPAHQTSFPPSIASVSPPQPSPASTVPMSRLSPSSPTFNQLSLLHPQPGRVAQPQQARSLSFSLPNMSETMMSQPVQGLGNQMTYMSSSAGGLAQGYVGHLGRPFMNTSQAHPPPVAQPLRQNDRPFKCNQCPQSFNRNHDLKRHKRIHLAVKPFPCAHCDKSFSRKDALKRHILVKGCGKSQPASQATPAENSISHWEQSGTPSGDDDDEESPPHMRDAS